MGNCFRNRIKTNNTYHILPDNSKKNYHKRIVILSISNDIGGEIFNNLTGHTFNIFNDDNNIKYFYGEKKYFVQDKNIIYKIWLFNSNPLILGQRFIDADIIVIIFNMDNQMSTKNIKKIVPNISILNRNIILVTNDKHQYNAIPDTYPIFQICAKSKIGIDELLTYLHQNIEPVRAAL